MAWSSGIGKHDYLSADTPIILFKQQPTTLLLKQATYS